MDDLCSSRTSHSPCTSDSCTLSSDRTTGRPKMLGNDSPKDQSLSRAMGPQPSHPSVKTALRHILHFQGYPVPQFPFTDCSLFLNSVSLRLFPASFPHFSSHVSKSTISMNHLHGSPCSSHCSVSEALRTQSNFTVITGAVLYKLPTV